MPQISLYVSQPDLIKIQNAAARESQSVSKWVITRIMTHMEPAYPPGYEALAGCIQDDSFCRPEQIAFSEDVLRESL